MLKSKLRQELNNRALGFSHDRPHQFVRSQWQRAEGVSINYLVYRWLFALFFVFVLIYSMVCAVKEVSVPGENMLIKWPIYLTHWGITLCTVTALFGASLVTRGYLKERKTGGYTNATTTEDDDPYLPEKSYILSVGFLEDHAQMPRIYKIYWIMHTISVVIALGITGSYFVVDYNPAYHRITLLNLLVHAFNSVFMMLDVVVVEFPFRLLHFIYPFSFSVTYFCFTVVYYLLGGTGKCYAPSIYPALDWSPEKIKRTLPIATLGALSVIIAHIATWLVVSTRSRLAEQKTSKSASNQVQPSNSLP